jgi:hypothetical protein
MAAVFVPSGLLPRDVNTKEKAVLLIMKGHELRIPPIQACQMMHIIKGKVCMAAELMHGLILRDCPGVKMRIELGTDYCLVEIGQRGGMQAGSIRWTLEDARKAGLLTNDNWSKYPRAMLRSRAISEAARTYFPDIIAGLYTPEEIAGDIVEMDAEGNVVRILPERAVDKPVHKSVDRVTESQPAGACVDATVLDAHPQKAKMDRIFPDTKPAWDWLDAKMREAGVSDEQGKLIREGAVGQTVAKLGQMIHEAKILHQKAANLRRTEAV